MIDFLIITAQILFWSIVVLTPLVVIHEFGHLLLARLFGVKIPEFGVGLPLTKHKLSKRFKNINWSIYPWLLGGFVRIYGDHDVLDDTYELYKTNPIQAKKEYPEARLAEIISQSTIQDILVDNFLEYDESWEWFSQIPYFPVNEMDENQTTQQLKALSIFKKKGELPSFLSALSGDTQKLLENPQKYYSKLQDSDRDAIYKALYDEYYRLRNLLTTLIEWEFEAKITTKGAKNKKVLREAFFGKNIFQQIIIISGGVIFNFITAFLLLIISFSIVGTIPETVTIESESVLQDQIDEYRKDVSVDVLSDGLVVFPLDDSPLKDAGVKAADQITVLADRDLDSNRFESRDEIKSFLNQYEGVEIAISYYRPSNDKSYENTVTLERDEDSGDVLLGAGVGYTIQRRSKNVFRSLGDSYNETMRITGATFQGIGDIIVALLPQTEDKSALATVTGPIGVGYASGILFTEYGFSAILYLIAVVSLALAVFNILPIPALDGGRLVILVLGKIFNKRYKQIETWAISITFIVLLGVAILVAGLDIARIIGS